MLKKSALFFFVLIIFCFSFSGTLSASVNNSRVPKRIVNVVYDDSRSMFIKGNKAWCYAKYSMEVFASMLGENDTMNIYCMSDAGANPKKLNGQNGPASNVKEVYEMVTPCDSTPFDTVKKAYSNLENQNADEKWLVIFTDGSFDETSDKDVQEYIDSKSNNINVMFLSVGESTNGIEQNPEKGIYFERATNSKEILTKITKICTIVFNSNKIPVSDISNPTIEFDIPMKELTVFAQGKNVKIEGIKDSKGKTYNSSQVIVQNNKIATSNKQEPEKYVSEDLKGCISTFTGDFEAGTYQLIVSGADTIEVYYKPNIAISSLLKDKNGKEVTDLNELEAGNYNIEFFLINNVNKKRIPDSKLLGNVTYEAYVNGDTSKSYDSGDTISIEEGTLSIDVIAHYLDYNTVEDHLNYEIYKNKKISYEIENSPTYIIKTDSIENGTEQTQIKLKIDGKEFSNEQWKLFEVPKIELKNADKSKITEFCIEKGEKGIINITPVLSGGKTTSGSYSDVKIIIISSTQVGSEAWTGKQDVTIPFKDDRSWMEQNIDKIVKGIIAGIVLFFTLGYIPPFKKYLPKSLKKRPKIDCKYKDYTLGGQTAKGKYIKDTFSTICPYRSQRGTIIYAPPGSGRAPALKVRAKNSSRMIITNQNAFKDRDDITFNGSMLLPSRKAKEIGAGVVITFTTQRATYTCIPKIK